MCFSATGSFAIAGVLTAVGGAAFGRSASPQLRPFAAIPLVFAAQQAAEGAVWLSMGDASLASLNHFAVNTFLAIALVVWPLLAPLSLRQAEGDASHRRALTWLAACGALVSLTAGVLLARWQPVPVIAGHSIRYDYAGATNATLSAATLAAYVVPTVLPFFASTTRHARMIGMSLAASLMITVLVERETLTSVWCFFAAVLSVQILVAVTPRQPVIGQPALT